MTYLQDGATRQKALENIFGNNLYYTSNSGEQIPFGQTGVIPLTQLIYFKECNRRKYKNHVKTMVKKIRKYGFLGVIVVFQSTEKDKDGNPIFYPAEGNHRVEALKIVFGNNPLINVPVLVLPYDKQTGDFNSDDHERAMEVIIELNKDNKGWTMKDYIEGWAKTNRVDYQWVNNVLNENEKKFKKLSVALTTYIFSQGKTPPYTKVLENGTFRISQFNKPFVKEMLSTVRQWTQDYGTDKWALHPTFLGNLVVKTYQTILGNSVVKLRGKEEYRIQKSQMEIDVENKKYLSSDVLIYFEKWLNYLDTKIDEYIQPARLVLERGTSKKDMKKHSSLFLPTASDDFKNLFEKWYDNFSENNEIPEIRGMERFKEVV